MEEQKKPQPIPPPPVQINTPDMQTFTEQPVRIDPPPTVTKGA
jgi:hypothetical protein